MDSKFTVSEARAPNGVSEWITALLCEGGSRKSEEVGEEGVLMGPTHTKKKKKKAEIWKGNISLKILSTSLKIT